MHTLHAGVQVKGIIQKALLSHQNNNNNNKKNSNGHTPHGCLRRKPALETACHPRPTAGLESLSPRTPGPSFLFPFNACSCPESLGDNENTSFYPPPPRGESRGRYRRVYGAQGESPPGAELRYGRSVGLLGSLLPKAARSRQRARLLCPNIGPQVLQLLLLILARSLIQGGV